MEEEYTLNKLKELVEQLKELETEIDKGTLIYIDQLSAMDKITEYQKQIRAISRTAYMLLDQQGFEYIIQPALKQIGLLKE